MYNTLLLKTYYIQNSKTQIVIGNLGKFLQSKYLSIGNLEYFFPVKIYAIAISVIYHFILFIFNFFKFLAQKANYMWYE